MPLSRLDWQLGHKQLKHPLSALLFNCCKHMHCDVILVRVRFCFFKVIHVISGFMFFHKPVSALDSKISKNIGVFNSCVKL